ncbi:MAG: 50S ribosomal protein L30 [Acidimicrobiia bacterium]|nr:50S ribosomal protein L30 [Acidimicrobiia bacterium]
MSESKAQRGQIQIKLIRSGIGFPVKQKKVIRGLGFRRLNQVITRPDTPEIRGMVFKIRHLVEIVAQ